MIWNALRKERNLFCFLWTQIVPHSKHTISVTRHAMYVQRNIEARPCNHSCRWKAKYSHTLNVSVVLVIQHTMRIPRILLSSLARRLYHTISPHFLINGKILRKKMNKKFFNLLYNFGLKFTHYKMNWERCYHKNTRVGTLTVATFIYNWYKIDTCFEVLLSFTVVNSIVYNPLPAMWKS